MLFLDWVIKSAGDLGFEEGKKFRFEPKWSTRGGKGALSPEEKRKKWPHAAEKKGGFGGVDQGGFMFGLGTSREGARDDRFIELLPGKGKWKLGSFYFNPEKWELEVNGPEGDAEVALLRWVEQFGDDSELADILYMAPGPMAARVGDPTLHGTPLGPGLGSPNVVIEGMFAIRVGVDTHVCPLADPKPHGGGPIAGGDSSVLVNGFPLARAGDFVSETSGPNPIVIGSTKVLAGKPAPPIPAQKPVAWEDTGELFDVDFGLDIELGSLKVLGRGGMKAGEGVSIRGKSEFRAAGLRVNPRGKIRMRLPGSRHLEFDFDRSLNFLTAGGEAELSTKRQPGDKRFNNKLKPKTGWFATDGSSRARIVDHDEGVSQ